MIYSVEVGVATHYPPAEHLFVYVRVEEDSAIAAELLACQIAMCNVGVKKAVSSLIVSWEQGDA